MKTYKRAHDFKALELKLNVDSRSPHTIYFTEHSVREHTSDRPSGKTLFIVNIPPYVDEQGLKNAFRGAGYVKSVQFCLKPAATEPMKRSFIQEIDSPAFRVAYLVFNKVVEVDKALKLTELLPLNNDKHETKVGLKKWIEDYNGSVVQAKTLKDNIETYMKQHDAEVKQKEKKEKQLEEEDEEGWVTVTRRGKVENFARTDKVSNRIMGKEQKALKEKLQLKNFYTFQIRESKMKHIVALRQKFEEDKKKIAQIKQSRRFKPF
ncbi:hypothetical protein K1T71_005863 [Dendrolimus kikuchii]|uniref:Uncharacterized protein n=1 Tax=Dendrolimus kikuchii TaxID=765133 RepID=A0ACC1D2R6_9NEOP|nr:hypothetical protein K1T71_005863 [Dendrolimus kikuchii]